jgi:hypothetical protein
MAAQILWGHFQEQMAGYQRTLWPNYLRPHATVFISFAFGLTVGWPIVVDIVHGSRSLGLMALSVTIFSLVGCYAAMGWLIPFVVAVIAMLAMNFDAVSGLVFGGGHEKILAGVIALGLSVLTGAIVHLLGSPKTKPGGAPIRLDAYSLRPRMTGEVNRAWAEQRRLFWPTSRVYLPANSGLWERARRWRSLNQFTAKMSLFIGAVLAAILFFLLVAFGRERSNEQWLASSVMYIAIIPSLMFPQSWLNLWRFLEADILRPLDRQSFFQEIGLAIAVQTLQFWGISAALIVVLCGWMNRWHFDVTALGALLALFFGAAALGLAIAFWLMRYRSPTLSMWSLMLLAAFLGVVIARNGQYLSREESSSYMVIGALVLAGLAALITRSAYHRWLMVELG